MRATWSWAVVLAAACIFGNPYVSGDEQRTNDYPLKYAAADEFCVPIVGFFDEVQRTIDRVGTHTFRHQPNGGYGLPVQDVAEG
jgi:hypothetical protein